MEIPGRGYIPERRYLGGDTYRGEIYGWRYPGGDTYLRGDTYRGGDIWVEIPG